MKQVVLLLLFTTISVISFSQTKLIAHRSHSGKDYAFDIRNSADNFGLPVPDSIRKLRAKPLSKKDSLRLKLLPKDSLQPAPSKRLPDSTRQAVIRKEVYGVLREVMYISSR